MLPFERDAAFRRRQSGPGGMQENRTAPPPNPRRKVVVENGEHIVEAIVTPKAFGARRVRQRYLAIVIPVGGGVAPAEIGPKRLDAQRRFRPPHPVRPVVRLCETPDARGRGAVAFFLQGAQAALSKRRRKL